MKVKAISLFSGGLDSVLATKLILEQGIDVIAFNYNSPFCINHNGKDYAKEMAKELKVPLIRADCKQDYIKMVKEPEHGYGKNMNPCIDCRVFILKKAKEIAKKEGAKFIFTGEVLDQRLMSQNNKSMKIIEKEACLEGKLLRPLSAKMLPLTEAEKNGWVDREKLLAVKGRSRKIQMELAERLGIKGYSSPAGGCLLTNKEFSNKLRDIFKHEKTITVRDAELLKVGRHFRSGENKIIVGRNESENRVLYKIKDKSDYVFEAQGCMGPVTVLRGKKNTKDIEIAAKLTARYCDSDAKKVSVRYGSKPNKSIVVEPATEKEINKLRVC